jgi:putative nucleotidyltransferase with HDIG domain
MGETPIRLPAALRQLPPLPQALIRAVQIMRNPNARRGELARVVALDQALTGLFLRMVNSAYYGIPRRITSLQEALNLLGYETVEATIFAISASKLLSSPLPAYRLDGGSFWQHSVAVAAGAEWIARRRKVLPTSDAYVAGLLHDVGKLVMDMVMDHQSSWGEESEEDTEAKSWLEVERAVTGQDHGAVGGLVVRSWNLPDRIVEAVACHHTPAAAEIDREFVSIIHLANAGALMTGRGLGVDGLRSTLEPFAIDQLAWTDEDMFGLFEIMQAAVSQAEDLLQAGG